MAGTWNPSWISGKYAYTFASDYAKITANTSLDITGSFRMGFQLKFDQLFLTGTIWSKSTGDVNNPAITSLNIKSVNGYLRVMISDGIKFIVYDTDERIFATYKAVQVDIVWDNILKELKVYKDAVSKAITINTSQIFYYTSPSLFTNMLVTATADLNFGKGQGQESFKGTLGGAIYSARTFTSPEIYDYFIGKEDMVSTPPTTEILFTTNSTGQYNIHKMYEDGSLPTQIINSSNQLNFGHWNNAKNKITYSNFGDSFVYTKNLTTNVNLRNSPSHSSVFNPLDATKIACIFNNRIGDSLNRANFANPDLIDSYELAITPNHNVTIYNMEQNIKYANNGAFALITKFGATGHAIAKYNNALEEASLVYIYEELHSYPIYRNTIGLTISPDGTKVAFAKKVADGTKYQIYSIDINGTGLTQLTAEAYDCIYPVFSPNGTKIAFSIKNGSGGTKNQIHLMNSNGSNIIRISNNAYDEFATDWK